MVELERYKWPIISIIVIIGVLMLMIAIGFMLGILSEDPDGLERALIDIRSEEWLEGLASPWEPILGWIDNDYIAGIIGILLTIFLIIAVFSLISHISKKMKSKNE
ncbi:MAG: hypothetical protein EU529_12140 [Promethearchaeota archaeon]|nr:MAG: hypothetical protein EU529_12140 [Candidatus Lokiarchaeota archaeon]